ncbi:hypothetical protein K432DRAFT_379381 [Lepidopterella palustris CBS 459.81]|uniref:Pre-mRNA polyadenylation factor Fip1 domain-containing protein n=1 Tax=Lepidopterella palustris CBS 459.81 TaxID=1314670 RepID=A0A8E2EGL1_9PEZI|nr:hypothetical protein K432DRAFT_379381 [Lepidopterella palustris CBS 459.81]
MEEDDDEFYGNEGATAGGSHNENKQGPSNGQTATKDEPMEEELESGEEEEEGSDSDVEIIMDRPQAAPKPPVQPILEVVKDTSQSTARTSQQPSTKVTLTAPAAPATALKQPGSSYPEVRTSTIDVNADPIYPPVGKPISQIDIDADLAENSKPWRLPGSDPSDYFNYGFDEFTWEMYRQRQSTMSNTLQSQKAETAQFQQMFGAGALPMPPSASNPSTATAIPNAPTGPAAQQQGGGVGGMAAMAAMMGMPGMPTDGDQMMAAMQAAMMQQGVTDPQALDFGMFVQGMQSGQFGGGGMGGQQQGGQQQQQQQQQQGYGQQGGQQGGQGYGGYGQQGGGGGGQYGGRGGVGRRGRWQ